MFDVIKDSELVGSLAAHAVILVHEGKQVKRVERG